MPDPFVHLHVASGYSLQYGASAPHVLVERAAEQEMDTLALTDRDGTYGAMKFVAACQAAGIRPILGVDLAYASSGGSGMRERGHTRGPVRGGAFRDAPWQALPRATFLASGRAGWASLCRLISDAHLSGERGRPVTSPEQVAAHLGDEVLVLLGPASSLGQAVAERHEDRARQILARWRALVPPDNLLIELVSHRLPASGSPGTAVHAARMAALAHEARVGAVLTNAVRHADRLDAPTVDVLDAARRLVTLDLRHLDRRNAEGFLKSGKQMHEIAEEICRHAGLDDRSLGGLGGVKGATGLLARTRQVADRCALDPHTDLGIGEVHFPEFSDQADSVLRARCEGAIGRRYGGAPRQRIWKRLDDELEMIRELGYASYFLTVAEVTDLIRERGVRCAARGSGAGSLVNYLLDVSGVDPIRHDLLMERFLSPLRADLPDIDLDVESARRPEIYDAILDRFGAERCVCVSMMDTYRVRHAVRDVGAALGMPPGEVDAIAKAFPHIRARDVRVALRELPELRAGSLGSPQRAGELELLFRLVERLDGLPRHIAVHPCGVLLSDTTLLDRTPVEASYAGYPMSQFDKDDIEMLGLLKLDVLGIRMQSAMAHAVAEIARVDGEQVDLDDEGQVPFGDPTTYDMISASKTLGVFQIESPGQRELVGKSGIESFSDIITDISLFRPGPVKSDMITPYLEAKQGWRQASYLHPDLRPILADTHGVVVFHEQVIEMIAQFAGVTRAEADEKRRALGDVVGMADTRLWFFPRALALGYPTEVVHQIWKILESFASFGFCKAHAAAFALPTFQSAWLKAHWPAHFLAGVLTHDPGMYPKRLILDDARQCGIAVLGLDVNASRSSYAVERLDRDPEEVPAPRDGFPDGRAWGIRLALAEVKGISEAEVASVVAGQVDPYRSLTDLWNRTRIGRTTLERLVLAGGFDRIYDIADPRIERARRRDSVTRRDLLLQVSDLDRLASATERASRGRGRGLSAARSGSRPGSRAAQRADAAGARSSTDPLVRAAVQSQTARVPDPVSSVQLSLDFGQSGVGEHSGLPEMTTDERLRAELEILGLDVSRHVVDSYDDFLADLEVVRSRDLLARRSRAEILVAGVKVATQTPPIRSGRRVIFLTLDDATGPIDATFFDDVQGDCAATVFGSWLLVVRGIIRRTGRRGISLRATGCWELAALHDLWKREGRQGVRDVIDRTSPPKRPQRQHADGRSDPADPNTTTPDKRRVLVHSSGFAMSPYSDIKPAGEAVTTAGLSRSLWHRSPGSPG